MRFDTSMFPGITAVLLSNPDERNGRLRLENDSKRAFQVTAGRDRVVVISPGATKEFDVEGETFLMGWHVLLDPAHAWPFPDKPQELEQQPYAEGSRPDTFLETKPGPQLGEVAGALNIQPPPNPREGESPSGDDGYYIGLKREAE